MIHFCAGTRPIKLGLRQLGQILTAQFGSPIARRLAYTLDCRAAAARCFAGRLDQVSIVMQGINPDLL